MKAFVFTLMFFLTFTSFGQTTREEIVKRTENGLKLQVNTYSGTGNAEKLIKITYYEGSYQSTHISNSPILIEYFGAYNRVCQWGEDKFDENLYGCVKREEFDSKGKIEGTYYLQDLEYDTSCTVSLIQ
jgi:hypothetical protein